MKMQENKKHSIIAWIFLLLTIVICVQATASLYTILQTNIATTVEDYSYNSFTRTVKNRKNSLENLMTTSWSNLSGVCSNLSMNYKDLLGEQKELTEDGKVEFLNNSTNDIMSLIETTGATGGFIILDDGENLQYSYSTVYLKNYDSFNYSSSGSNLVLMKGPVEVSKAFDFQLASNWSYGITLTEDNYPILDIPEQATSITKNLDYLGYWHISNDIANDKLRVLTYSMPIFDENENSIGVVGVEISQEYLYKFLPNDEFGDKGSHGYFLIDVAEDNKSFEPVFLNGAMKNGLLELNQPVLINDLPLSTHNLEEEPKLITVKEDDICVYYEDLSLYTNNSPYKDHKITIAGLVDLDNITSFTKTFWESLYKMIIACLIAGLIISYIIGRQVAKPILKLSRAVAKHDVENKFDFKETKIKEIDELSSVITQMQENILRSASRTDKILELLDIGVGSFEYEKNTANVTVSSSVYKMLDLDEYQGKKIPKDIFFEKLALLKSDPIPEVVNTYVVRTEETNYYKIVEFEQENVLLGVIEDATNDVEKLLVMNYERNYDLLTGIYNRRAFHQKAMDVMKQGNLGVAGFVMFDLDNLKYVNDTFGHDSGDMYIKTAATTIHGELHKNGVVGRMSGDEFYALLYGFDSKASLMKCLDNLYVKFENEPIEMPNSTELKIRVSGGIAWYGEDSYDLEELKQYADFAMYKGKHTIKGEMRQFERKVYLEESFMLSGKAELNRLLDNELLDFVFQPIVSAKTGDVYGYELLMRPISKILTTPLKLLQIATLEGKLWKVEKIVLFKALSLFKKHQSLFGDARLFINSIPTENLKNDEYETLKELYEDCFDKIVIEITEQDQLNENVIEDKLAQLKRLKLDIALDDYGSGYANDIGLIKMNPNIVKIDRSLISNVHVDPSRQTIIHKIIAFCKERDICIVGEGIETEQELEYLISAGIDLAQGYYISRPMEVPAFDKSDISKKISALKNNI